MRRGGPLKGGEVEDEEVVEEGLAIVSREDVDGRSDYTGGVGGSGTWGGRA